MKKLVVANRGCSNLGKSAAIKKVYELLFSKYGNVYFEPQGGDISAIIVIEGHKVGVESQGDPGYEMENTIRFFVREGCEIIVTACRTKGTTFTAVRDYLGGEEGFDIIWSVHDVFRNYSNQSALDQLNENYAERVVGIIERRISGVI